MEKIRVKLSGCYTLSRSMNSLTLQHYICAYFEDIKSERISENHGKYRSDIFTDSYLHIWKFHFWGNAPLNKRHRDVAFFWKELLNRYKNKRKSWLARFIIMLKKFWCIFDKFWFTEIIISRNLGQNFPIIS